MKFIHFISVTVQCFPNRYCWQIHFNSLAASRRNKPKLRNLNNMVNIHRGLLCALVVSFSALHITYGMRWNNFKKVQKLHLISSRTQRVADIGKGWNIVVSKVSVSNDKTCRYLYVFSAPSLSLFAQMPNYQRPSTELYPDPPPTYMTCSQPISSLVCSHVVSWTQ